MNYILTILIYKLSPKSNVFFSIVTFSIIIHKKIQPSEKHYIIASWIYIGYAFQFIGLGSLDWVAPNRSSIDKGVIVSAAEPTYFAIILFFISYYYYY